MHSAERGRRGERVRARHHRVTERHERRRRRREAPRAERRSNDEACGSVEREALRGDARHVEPMKRRPEVPGIPQRFGNG